MPTQKGQFYDPTTKANDLAIKKVPCMDTQATLHNLRTTGRTSPLDRCRRYGWGRQDRAGLGRNADVSDASQLDTQHAGALDRSVAVDHKNIG